MILRLATANENRSEREGAASVVPSPHLPVGETYFQRSREAAEGWRLQLLCLNQRKGQIP